jgi:Domain of unknown function (DUF4145)
MAAILWENVENVGKSLECQESCAVSGNYDTHEYGDEDGAHWCDRGHPTLITPPPPMIHIPEDCPQPIREELTASFGLFWSDLASCLNHIRNTLELVLDELKVPKSALSKKDNTRHQLTLHNRIKKLESNRPKLKELCERMMAVKHLGNVGSHPGMVVRDWDVFDGLDILERLLQDIDSGHPGQLARVVKQINKRKGPR